MTREYLLPQAALCAKIARIFFTGDFLVAAFGAKWCSGRGKPAQRRAIAGQCLVSARDKHFDFAEILLKRAPAYARKAYPAQGARVNRCVSPAEANGGAGDF